VVEGKIRSDLSTKIMRPVHAKLSHDFARAAIWSRAQAAWSAAYRRLRRVERLWGAVETAATATKQATTRNSACNWSYFAISPIMKYRFC